MIYIGYFRSKIADIFDKYDFYGVFNILKCDSGSIPSHTRVQNYFCTKQENWQQYVLIHSEVSTQTEIVQYIYQLTV